MSTYFYNLLYPQLIDPNNAESGMKYTLNENEISYEEYTELCSKIFATEVNQCH